MNHNWYLIKEWSIEKLTDFFMTGIKLINPWKNRCLAGRLHKLADSYDPRPEGKWR